MAHEDLNMKDEATWLPRTGNNLTKICASSLPDALRMNPLVTNDKLYINFTLLAVLCSIVVYLFVSPRGSTQDLSIPIVNRYSRFEPHFFSRLRWAFRSVNIIDGADAKHKNRPYRLARGDADFIVLPASRISELNQLPQNTISSRKSHSLSLIGYLTGMDVVRECSIHVKTLLNRITPALPTLLEPFSSRVQASISQRFPSDHDSWKTIRPLDDVVHCVSQAIVLSTFGTPTCDDPQLIRLSYEHTKNIFSIMFIMRLVPNFLQPALVWCLPYKWRLERDWKVLQSFVVSAVARNNIVQPTAHYPDLISCMVAEDKDRWCDDPVMLTRLVGSIIAGGTYSSAAFIMGVIYDLVAHPHFLREIRDEIYQRHHKIQGRWDTTAFNTLLKLDSAMKETSRLAPSSMLVYSRFVQEDCILPSGLKLRRGDQITTSGRATAMDPDNFPRPSEYDALRAYRSNIQTHITQPFRSIEGGDHRWGAGRWACPGRYMASILSKVILVKLLDEYDFKFVTGQRPLPSVMHEFIFFPPQTEILVRKRTQASGIVY